MPSRLTLFRWLVAVALSSSYALGQDPESAPVTSSEDLKEDSSSKTSLFKYTPGTVLPGFPDKVYGVNLASWLVSEPWMFPEEWVKMGGNECLDCGSGPLCSEAALMLQNIDSTSRKQSSEKVNDAFKAHWQSWFTQSDADQMKDAGLNLVKIPIGYWIIESLVDGKSDLPEFYPPGGIHELVRGLKMLKDAGIRVVLDQSGMPGVSNSQQMHTGKCTDKPDFFGKENYKRALVWTTIMTALSHILPEFDSVVAIHAVDKPLKDAEKTPGLDDFYKNFIYTVRTVELAFGVPIEGLTDKFEMVEPQEGMRVDGRDPNLLKPSDALTSVADWLKENFPDQFSEDVLDSVKEAAPKLQEVLKQLNIKEGIVLGETSKSGTATKYWDRKRQLVTSFMEFQWQHRNNPAEFALGPVAYDAHNYYGFGATEETEDAYMKAICNIGRLKAAADVENTPLWFGEWSLNTAPDSSDDFLKQFADAQKLMYSNAVGWIFSNWKFEDSETARIYKRPAQWSYQLALEKGYFTKDPAELHDPNVCDKWIDEPTQIKATTEPSTARELSQTKQS